MLKKTINLEINKAVEIIQKGGIVAFPTETVYGLGANALDEKAVKKIFKMKGRPTDNPLILHISDISELEKIRGNVSEEIKKNTEKLAKNFWPGPLTLVFPKNEIIPKEVTAGGDTVAVRIPNNKIALELIKKTGLPLAAPSANLSGKPSPTKAEHVYTDFAEKVFILDGGDCQVGIESTVLDLTTKTPTILRYGGISYKELKKVLREVRIHSFLLKKKNNKVKKNKEFIKKSPGMKYRHYAPEAELILTAKTKIPALIKEYQKQEKKVGVMATIESAEKFSKADVILLVGSEKDLKSIAQNIFDILRKFDKLKVDVILTEIFSKKGIGLAVMDRLERAKNKS